jgi:alpha-beta hydrolase superfamily lysophospholipase
VSPTVRPFFAVAAGLAGLTVLASAIAQPAADPLNTEALNTEAPVITPDVSAPPPFTPPDTSRAFLDFSKAWPRRLAPADHALAGVTLDIDPNAWWSGYRTRLNLVSGPHEAADLAAAKELAPTVTEVRFERGGSYLFEFAPPRPDAKRPRRLQANAAVRFVSLRPAPEPDTAEIERTWFVLYEPSAPASDVGPATRGTVLLMPGMFGTPEGTVEQLARRLRARGWHVLRMLAHPSRFTQRVRFEVDLTRPLAEPASAAAREMGDRAAECAYAARAAFAHIERTRPRLAELPRVAIGFSGGAMVLPTVVALEPARYHAAVLVGGGAHFWLVNEHSNYAPMIDALRMRWTGREVNDADRGAFADAYLDAAPLDSFHTAKSLHAKPVLMIQGEADRAVPSSLGDCLWERLHKPERWMRPGGHEALFLNLSRDFDGVLTWLDTKLGLKPPADPAEPHPQQDPQPHPQPKAPVP